MWPCAREGTPEADAETTVNFTAGPGITVPCSSPQSFIPPLGGACGGCGCGGCGGCDRPTAAVAMVAGCLWELWPLWPLRQLWVFPMFFSLMSLKLSPPGPRRSKVLKPPRFQHSWTFHCVRPCSWGTIAPWLFRAGDKIEYRVYVEERPGRPAASPGGLLIALSLLLHQFTSASS